MHNLATQALGELKNHFGNGARDAELDDHAASGQGRDVVRAGSWRCDGDSRAACSAAACRRRRRDELAQRGFDGKAVPELNYAPSLGLYLMRPAPRSLAVAVAASPFARYRRSGDSGFGRASLAARALDHLAHARMLAANRRHPRLEARHRAARCGRGSTTRSCRP